MHLAMVGLNYRTAPIEVREKLSFRGEETSEALGLLSAKDDILECAILSTCNRVEIYGLLREARVGLLRDFLRDFHKYGGPLDPHLYTAHEENVVRHLCRVACGMDSMVLGEPQVFGQVKGAYRVALECGAVGHAFQYLFPLSFSLVKKVRSRSNIGAHHVSVGYAAVMLARDVFGDLHNKRVMVLGAGEMGKVTAKDLRAGGAREIMVVNRTFEKAVSVAERVKGTPIMLHELREYLAASDIVISSVGGADPVVRADDIRRAADARGEVPMLVIDIAVPRSVDPTVGDLPGIRLCNVDDLKEVADKGARERMKAAEKAEEIIARKIDDILKKVKSCDIVPVMVGIREKAERIRKEGLEKAAVKLSVSPQDRIEIESLTKSIVSKILFHSEVEMREYSNSIKR